MDKMVVIGGRANGRTQAMLKEVADKYNALSSLYDSLEQTTDAAINMLNRIDDIIRACEVNYEKYGFPEDRGFYILCKVRSVLDGKKDI